MPGAGGRARAAEALLRLALLLAFCYMETMVPFFRYISAQDMETIYKHPRKDSYVPAKVMWSVVLLTPCITAPIGYLFSGDKDDLTQSLLAVSLALGINGLFTNTVKLVAGRPRPDFFYRCFPDGVMSPDMQCSGTLQDIVDGRKSFPSGHSSCIITVAAQRNWLLLFLPLLSISVTLATPSLNTLSFCSLGFVSIWLFGRLGVFTRRGKASGARVALCLVPLYAAMLIALSRSCDYHHHWQDILVGSALGLTTAYACYRQYYNPLASELAGVPYVTQSRISMKASSESDCALDVSSGMSDKTPLLNGSATKRDSKWI